MNRIKKVNDELKAARPTLEEIRAIPRVPVSILVENVRSVHNVGAIFRSADGFCAEKIYLTGYTAYPPRDDLHKTALGSEESVPWEYDQDPVKVARRLKDSGVMLVSLEQTFDSVSIYQMQWQFPVCCIVGNEVTGVSDELIEMSQANVEIPMQGVKQSLNVSVATGVLGYEISRCYYQANNIEF